MPPEARDWLILFLQDLRVHARHKAKESLRKAKLPLYCYWSVVGVWSGHLVKVLRAIARECAGSAAAYRFSAARPCARPPGCGARRGCAPADMA